MPIQFLLSGLLIVFAVLALLRRRLSPVVSLAFVVTAIAGVAFVWNPALSTDLALAIGVGRGADLVFYCFIVIGLILSFWLYIALISVRRQITVLAREVAINGAQRPMSLPRERPGDED